MASKKRDGFFKQRGSRKWSCIDPVTGKRTSTGFEDKEAAKLWRAQRERIAADPSKAKSEAAQLGEWVERFLDLKARTTSEATLQVAQQKLGHFVRIWGPQLNLSAIDPDLFDSYVAQRREEDVTDHTITKEWVHLRGVLKLAKRGGAFPGDIEALRPLDLHAGYKPRTRALTRPELGALLTVLEPGHMAWVCVMVALGLRKAEAERLLPSDISATEVLVRGTKTAGSRRTVPILSLYRPLLEMARPHLPLPAWPGAHKSLAWACKRAGIDYCSPNDFRRTHATLLHESGVDRDTIRRFLGHTSTAMVDKVYGQPRTEALAERAEAQLLTAPKILDGSTSVGACGETPERASPVTAAAKGESGTGNDAGPKRPARSRAGKAEAVQIESPSERFRRVSWEWFRKVEAA